MENKFYEFKNLAGAKNVRNGVSTRDFGTMKNPDGSRNIANLAKFLHELKTELQPVGMLQIHGAYIATVHDNNLKLIPNTDGLITDAKNIPLVVLTADCLPILFFDPIKRVVGILHGGRKGLSEGVIQNMLKKFKSDFNSDVESILVGVGPGIEKKCYEVNGELLDIRKSANELLMKEGIREKNIENLDICTKCNADKFYSYRGGDGNRRFATVISLV